MTVTRDGAEWVRRFHPATHPRARLVCFPHAGGSAAYFRPLSAALPASVELHQFFRELKINYNSYEADNPTALQSAIQDIDAKEKKRIQYTITVPGHDYSFEFLMAALILAVSLLVAKNLRVYSWQAA